MINETNLFNHKRIKRILGGLEARPSQYSWQTELILQNLEKAYKCSGSLVSDNFVLTAAHCVIKATIISVILGHDVSILEMHSDERLVIQNVTWIPHPCFSAEKEQYQYDIALIKLLERINFSTTIHPIQLPKNEHKLYENAEATAIGWGNTGVEGTERSNKLLKAKMQIINRNECANAYKLENPWGATFVGPGYELNKHPGNYFICVRGNHQAICIGDSGGSLSINENGQWVLIGIASFTAYGCKEWKNPQSFVRISKHLMWIKNVMLGNYSWLEKCVYIPVMSSRSKLNSVKLANLLILMYIILIIL